MARNQRKRGRRPSRKSKKGGLSFGSLSVQLVSVLIIVFLVFFLIAAKIISNITGALLCMLSLSVLSYFIVNSPKKSRRKRRRPRKKQTSDDPQFYTALPSTVGLTEVPEEFSTSEVKLPPRPSRVARRQREFVMYPPSVSGGDYSDSYTQIGKDTVLRLRGEMIPEMGTRFLPGNRMSSLPSVEEIKNILKTTSLHPVAAAAEPVAVAAEPVAVAAEPVAVAAEPVATSVSAKTSEEESEDMDFDMEWD
ncbi:MAG: hypothetical protein P8R32_05480 [Candidatus Poseidoniia archaeon]|nr:hypothetical protein [Candidatus Poseidoniia archaeon]